MPYDKGHQALYQGYYVPDIMEQVSKMMNSMKIGSAQIRDLAVKNAHIQYLETDKLVAGEVLISPDLLDGEFTSGIQTTFQVLSGKIEANITLIDEAVGTLSSRITQEVDHITMELLALDTGFGDFKSTIEQRATDIESSVSYLNNDISDLEDDIIATNTTIAQTANSITQSVTSEVNRLDGRVDSTNSSVTQLSNQIVSKITAGDARSIFIQEAGSFTFDASQINFVGQVFGSSSATFLGSINTSEDINIGNNLYLGTQSSSTSKMIRFNNATNIVGSTGFFGDEIDINATAGVNFNGGRLNLGNDRVIYQDFNDNNRLKHMVTDTTGIWQDSGGAIYFRVNGVNRHTFASDGGKLGGSIKIDDTVYGMSPIDSPRALFFDIIRDIQVNGKTKIYFHSVFKKTVSSYDLFLNNPNVVTVEKTEDYIILDGEGLVTIQVVGTRIEYEDQYYVDLTRMSEDMNNGLI